MPLARIASQKKLVINFFVWRTVKFLESWSNVRLHFSFIWTFNSRARWTTKSQRWAPKSLHSRTQKLVCFFDTETTSLCQGSKRFFQHLKHQATQRNFFPAASINSTNEAEDFKDVGKVCFYQQFITGKTAGCFAKKELTTIHKMFLGIVNYLFFNPCGVVGSSLPSNNIKIKSAESGRGCGEHNEPCNGFNAV